MISDLIKNRSLHRRQGDYRKYWDNFSGIKGMSKSKREVNRKPVRKKNP